MIARVKHFLLLLIVLFIGYSASAQVEVADDLFDNLEFRQAIKFYEKAETLDDDQLTKYAFSQLQIHNYTKAEELYKKVVKIQNTDAINFYYYGICLKNNKKYKKAEEYFLLSKAFNPINFYNNLMMESLDEIPAIHKKKSGLEVLQEESINSPIAEFSAKWYKDGILFIKEIKQDGDKKRPQVDFSSDYNDIDNLEYGTAERPLSVMYYAPFKDGEYGEVKMIAKSDKFHIGTFDINKATGEIYFTKVDLINNWSAGAKSHPRIFKAKLDEEKSELVEVKKVSIKKLSDEIGAGHPALSSDGKTMYFSSNLPGGFGGSDLYSSTLDEKGNWQEPINLGEKINTEGDEVFPSVYKDNTLYFSTNGMAGFGGLDIFKAPITSTGVGQPEILAAPQNSPADDFGLLIDEKDEMLGFVTSNRFDGSGDDDLFYFQPEQSKTFVEGIVTDDQGNPVENALVKLYEDGIEVGQVKTDKNGRYHFDLEEDKEYELIASTRGFGAKEKISTDENWNSEEDVNMTLTPTDTVQGFVSNEDGSRAGNTKIELLDDDGNVILTARTDEDGYYQFVLDENEEYELVASKDGYRGSEKIVTDSNWDTNKDTNIVLRPTEIVQGIVRTEDGNPASGILVKLLDENGVELDRVYSDEDGKYEFTLDPDKKYTLIASDVGLGAIENIITDNNWDGSKGLDLILRPTDTAQGMVTNPDGSVASNVRMELLDEDGNVIFVSRTDEDGFYQFVLDDNKKYEVVATDGNLKGSEVIETNDDYNTAASTDIQLKPSGTFVEGTIRNEDGSPAAGVLVKLYDEDGNVVATTTTDENGNYHFDLEENKNYQILAETDGYSGLENIFTGDNWDSSQRLDITLKPSGKPTSGIVTDNRNDNPLEGVKVTLIDLKTEKKLVVYSDADGKFNITLSPNSNYTLKLEKEGYFPKSIDIPTGGELPDNIDLNLKENLGMDFAGFDVNAIYFDYNKSSIRSDSKAQLKNLIATLKASPKSSVLIKSYADCRGGDKYNISLSWKRSSAVKQYLIAHGINEKRIRTKSMGATNFVNNCYKPEMCSEEEHALNRRSEFEIKFK